MGKRQNTSSLSYKLWAKLMVRAGALSARASPPVPFARGVSADKWGVSGGLIVLQPTGPPGWASEPFQQLQKPAVAVAAANDRQPYRPAIHLAGRHGNLRQAGVAGDGEEAKGLLAVDFEYLPR